jgi:bacillithiol system protein YtxJ
LEDDWNFGPDEIKPYFLDVVQHRVISTIVADQFLVHHESPQLLLIKNGECTYDATQLDISVSELRECFYD